MAVNGVYIVQGELNAVVALIRRVHRWPPHQPQLLDEQDPLLRNFADLRDVLNSVADLADMAPNTFLGPFLDVIRSEQTSGPVTGQALASVGKFLSYGLVDPSSITAASAVENIADAVTHARFVGTDPGSDEVVLLKILQVLRTLLLTPVGSLLTNESVCEIMQSCFRICFETRLSELLRKAAEYTLSDMIQLLFTRLPTFKEDPTHPYIRRLKMRTNLVDPGQVRRRKKYKGKSDRSGGVRKSALKQKQTVEESSELSVTEGQGDVSIEITEPKPDIERPLELPLDSTHTTTDQTPLSSDIENIPSGAESPMEEVAVPSAEDSRSQKHVVDVHGDLGFTSDEEGLKSDIEGSKVDLASLDPDGSPKHGRELATPETEQEIVGEKPAEEENVKETTVEVPKIKEERVSSDEDDRRTLAAGGRVNQRGVRFTVDLDEQEASMTSLAKGESKSDEEVANIPYGLPCVRELFRFLISLTNPLDNQNTEQMVQMGLNLLTVSLEAGADYLGPYTLLMPLVKNELCRSLFLLLQTDKLTVFASALRVCFLLFEALRTHLKFQLEMYLSRMMDLVVTENPRISFEQKEMALEALVQLWRIPGLVTELYLNYDCDLYCSNLFEDLTKLLSKNAFPVTGLYSTHILSLDALLTVVNTIEANCHYRMMTHKHQRGSSVGSTGPEAEEAHKTVQEGLQMGSPTHQLPAASGFTMGQKLSAMYPTTEALKPEWDEDEVGVDGEGTQKEGDKGVVEALQLPQVRPNRMPISSEIPSHEDLIAQKKKKKLLTQGTELFNQKPPTDRIDDGASGEALTASFIAGSLADGVSSPRRSEVEER